MSRCPRTNCTPRSAGSSSALQQRSGDGVTLAEVDQAWLQLHLTLVQNFTRTLTRDYASPLATHRLRRQGGRGRDDQPWVRRHTHGKIPKLVSGGTLDSTAVVLTDAVYLDAKWANGFDPHKMTNQPFHLATGPRSRSPR